jgi:hypothetical protein
MNPFGVRTDVKVETRIETCECCRLRFAYETYALRPEARDRCDFCPDHQLDGTPEQVVAAMREHEPRLHERIRAVYDKADQMQELVRAKNREIGEMKAEDEKRREQVRSALRSRDRWRKVAEAVMDEHSQVDKFGKCLCSNKAPCPTVLAVETVDFGLARDMVRSKPGRDIAEYEHLLERRQMAQDLANGTYDGDC